ncbi:hypothetical protein [Saccharicrinis fermentans]|uniref:Uncharacterized protein n=1 Tax=Saccharicrinis fermentans DSM 9555 = JCM 21142 TaxID=869213 RepID=W7YIX0_9BACT|nr:hypothetical protein [Saccharicrinis fermentans]GAF04416.1 hypothetical protein JCM21142_83120 [Saccharicrinis fermentans DSM 9555 = JCM 21142]
MKSRKVETRKSKVSSHEDFEEKKGNRPNPVNRNKTTKIQEELADDFGEILGEGFHGFDDDYYFDEEDLY